MKTMHEADIAKLVKDLRERMKLTQEQFAQKVGVTYSTVNHWENGKRMPQPFLVRRLLELKEEFGSAKNGEATTPSRGGE
ncbi:MAG TPA: helix-turn-helix transcriptional regulator [Sedimentisphaerales bacterium]|nr:helix-turn-helix transcriptional regulator [Sedimentisphaerales bacterium]